ncbi:hypothetical protein OF83DRAFT_1095285 [Amylostereum chailletii]|nr:hypothetical protein OF83DRAFT_1095285 [Amylostereum chailletii]
MSEDYEVEDILKAKAYKRGRKLAWKYFVKWKDYDHSDNTWEPPASFLGSADRAIEQFWQRVDLHGRDLNTPDDFKQGEEILPRDLSSRRGQPPSEKRASSSRRVPAARRASSNESQPPSRATTTRKRGRAVDVETPVQNKRKRPSPEKTRSEKAVEKLLIPNTRDKPPSSPSVPDSEDEVLLTYSTSTLFSPKGKAASTGSLFGDNDHDGAENDMVVDPPETSGPKLPAHRHRAANPSVKRLGSETFEDSLKGAISAKAKALGATAASSSRQGKPGPGRSSQGARNSSVLTFEKGGLKTVRRKNRPLPTKEEDLLQDTLEVANQVGSEGAPIDSVGFDTVNALDGSITHVTIPIVAPAPTGEQLLELAGLNQEEAEALEDFVDDQEGALVEAPVAPESPSISSPSVVFSPSAPIGSTSASASAPKGAWSWPMKTIFGSFSIRSTSADTKPMDEGSSSLPSPVRLKLDTSLTIPIVVKDITPPTSIPSSSLEEILSEWREGLPGKLYNEQAALSLLEAVDTGGSAARIALPDSCSEQDKEAFTSFHSRLTGGNLVRYVVHLHTA